MQRNDVCPGVETRQRVAAGRNLRPAYRVGDMQHLPLQVGQVDRIAIGQRQRAYTRCGEIHRRRRSKPASTNDQRTRIEQLLLAFDANLGEQDVARIAQ